MSKPRRPGTLVINRSDSYCNNCRGGALTSDKKHSWSYGWGEQGPGCGIEFDSVDSDYSGLGKYIDRPDLERVGFLSD